MFVLKTLQTPIHHYPLNFSSICSFRYPLGPHSLISSLIKERGIDLKISKEGHALIPINLFTSTSNHCNPQMGPSLKSVVGNKK